jgi:phage tail-like protein
MAEFSVNSHRIDPYKNFKFRVKWDGKYVAGLQKCGGLKKTTEMIEWRESGDPSLVRKLTGRTSYQPLTMEAGVTHDTAFEDWANLVNNFGGDAAMSLVKYRKNLTIELLNEQGTVVIAYKLHRAWVSEYQAMPDLDANAHAVAITTIKLEFEGFERDTNVTEPAET